MIKNTVFPFTRKVQHALPVALPVIHIVEPSVESAVICLQSAQLTKMFEAFTHGAGPTVYDLESMHGALVEHALLCEQHMESLN